LGCGRQTRPFKAQTGNFYAPLAGKNFGHLTMSRRKTAPAADFRTTQKTYRTLLSVSSIVGFLKGKSAIRLHEEFSRSANTGKHFWIRGYFVSTVGRNEKIVRAYIRNQELSNKRQLNLAGFE